MTCLVAAYLNRRTIWSNVAVNRIRLRPVCQVQSIIYQDFISITKSIFSMQDSLNRKAL